MDKAQVQNDGEPTGMPMGVHTEVGFRLRAERERLGLTQPQFAERGGIKRATQHLYESGSTSPNVDYLLKIDSAGADVMFILFGPTRKTVDTAILSHHFREVDKTAVDATGQPLPLEVRERFFLLLVAASSGVLAGHENVTRITDGEPENK